MRKNIFTTLLALLLFGSIAQAGISVSTAPSAGATALTGLSDYAEWATYTPTYTARGSMTWTSVTAAYARWKQVGNTVTIAIEANGTTGGTADNALEFTAPSGKDPANSSVFSSSTARDSSSANGTVLWEPTCSCFRCFKGDSSNYGLGTNRRVITTISYEIS